MDTIDLNCSSSSAGSNESTTVPTASFYGKKVNDYPQVKIKKLPASVIEYYLGKPPNEAEDVFKPKLSKAKRKLVPVIGSDATRHNIKPLSAKKRKQNEKMKKSKEIVLEIEKLPASVIEYYLGKSPSEDEGEYEPKSSRAERHEIEDNSEEEKENDLRVIGENRRNPRRKAAIDGSIKMTNASNNESFSTRKSRSKFNNQVKREVRKNPSRKAAIETYEKITKAYKDMDDTEDFDTNYSKSSISSDSDDDDVLKKPSKDKVNQHEEIPEPEFSEYEKAAQEKLALHKDFLKSLNIHSLDEK